MVVAAVPMTAGAGWLAMSFRCRRTTWWASAVSSLQYSRETRLHREERNDAETAAGSSIVSIFTNDMNDGCASKLSLQPTEVEVEKALRKGQVRYVRTLKANHTTRLRRAQPQQKQTTERNDGAARRQRGKKQHARAGEERDCVREVERGGHSVALSPAAAEISARQLCNNPPSFHFPSTIDRNVPGHARCTPTVAAIVRRQQRCYALEHRISILDMRIGS
jgi:hypothetical protein